LWHRYLVYNPLFVLLVLAQALRVRRFAHSDDNRERVRSVRSKP
jgi:hypothetical protein